MNKINRMKNEQDAGLRETDRGRVVLFWELEMECSPLFSQHIPNLYPVDLVHPVHPVLSSSHFFWAS